MKRKQKIEMGFLMTLFIILIYSVGIMTSNLSHDNDTPEKTVSQVEVKQVPGSKIVFAEDSFDFGQIPYNRKVTHTFQFQSAGNSPLLLAKEASSKPVEGC